MNALTGNNIIRFVPSKDNGQIMPTNNGDQNAAIVSGIASNVVKGIMRCGDYPYCSLGLLGPLLGLLGPLLGLLGPLLGLGG